MNQAISAEEIKKRLRLQPLSGEGGFFRETYRSIQSVVQSKPGETRSAGTVIYYLLTDEPGVFSELHRLDGDEIYHFYLGDPVEMLLLHPDGRGEVVILGGDISAGMRLQQIVPAGSWQGSRLMIGGKYALMGTNMTPAFEFSGYSPGNRQALIREYPAFKEMIHALTRTESR